MLARVYALASPRELAEPEYADGLRDAVSAMLEYGVAALELEDAPPPPIPVALLTQARTAVRCEIGLDAMQRRYFAAYAALGEFTISEAEVDDLVRGPALQRLLQAQAGFFDRMLVAVSEEYRREAEVRTRSLDQRRLEGVQRLLAGEPIDTSQLAYDFDAWHIGATLTGPEAKGSFLDVASTLGCNPLVVRRGEGAFWGWLGVRHRADSAAVLQAFKAIAPGAVSLAIGEPARGLEAGALVIIRPRPPLRSCSAAAPRTWSATPTLCCLLRY